MVNWKTDVRIKFVYKDKEYKADLEVSLHREWYGADADGNRGVLTTFVDDLDVTELKEDGKEVPITEELLEVIEKEFDKVEANIEYPDEDDNSFYDKVRRI